MISDVAISPRVGRKTLSPDSPTKRTQVRFEADLMDRIDALVGPNRRAEFLREAAQEKLERCERDKEAGG